MSTPENPMRPIGEALIYGGIVWASFFASCAFAHYTSEHYPEIYLKIVKDFVWIIIAACSMLILLIMVRTAQAVLKWFKT